MSGYGTLNGQPVGPELPDPVPCERCGHPVWLAKDFVVFKKDPLFPNRDLRLEMAASVWELALLSMPGSPWSLNPHTCRVVPEPGL